MIFIKNPKELEKFDSYNGNSGSDGYYFRESVCVLSDLIIKDGAENCIGINGKIYISKDVKTNVPVKEYKSISRKTILRAEKRWNRLMEKDFVCFCCGGVFKLPQIIQKKQKLFHFEHYWCENGVCKELKEGKFFVVYSRYKGKGNQCFKEKISKINGKIIKELLYITNKDEAQTNYSHWYNVYSKTRGG